MGKYSPLADYFAKQAADSLTLSFDEIEGIISDDLPKSAYTSEDWWTKSSSPQSTAWSRAGYEVSINLNDRKAEFIRTYDVSRDLSYVDELEDFYQRWDISNKRVNANEFQKFK
ncbi:MAG TPA: hypothetical protein DCK95_11905, partial [Anaerolineaceae bacterium]|nr:hypothetical protein [Anaerolineaceae bacterium]